jgi:hypothetical protein
MNAFKKILSEYKQLTKYSVYLLIYLTIMDVISTYIGITYFNAYEANQKTAQIFNTFGLFLPSALKFFTVILFGYAIKNIWKNSESLLYVSNYWMNSIGIISILNIIFIILILNVFYFIIVLNNINILYRLI